MALRFFATGSYQRSIGENLNLSIIQTAVHRCLHEITELKFPQDRNANNQNFMDRFNFPGILGCIDCTHIAILKPHQKEHNFLNRKGYHSLNVQIICDTEMKIVNINANFPSASHDSFIWRQSQVRNLTMVK
ncbi:hypothetical protein NQ314_012423 [Rhamnusium bicolor]|uniref:DDE Tnp4 domain-containing protein n=1 Tax=Rhamnusium bicolor TaxID=1586634 RepID=A0AAV8XCB8_9CUCU|nr:hypothetical protein NQ314_012423 [Rhamnusium bicolor]